MIPAIPYFTIVFLSEQMGMLPEKASGFAPNRFCFLSLILGSVKGPKELLEINIMSKAEYSNVSLKHKALKKY